MHEYTFLIKKNKETVMWLQINGQNIVPQNRWLNSYWHTKPGGKNPKKTNPGVKNNIILRKR